MACGITQKNIAAGDKNVNGGKPQDANLLLNESPSGLPFPIAFNTEQATNALLTTGSYSATGYVDNIDSKTVDIINRPVQVEVESGEKKRVLVEKFQVLTPVNGRSKFIFKFRVIDNFLPLIPVFWTVAGISGLTAGKFFFDSVNKFTESSAGTIITIVSSIAALFFLIKK